MNITIESLKDVQNEDAIKYQDMKLDLEFDYTRNNELLKTNEVRDVKVSYDLNAIRNSLYNLFNTNRGEKLLTPTFGLSLTQYLFEPVSQATAEIIADEISKGIRFWEPRVQLTNLNIIKDYENNQYVITIVVNIPQLRANDITFNGVLNTRGFIFNS